MRKKELEKKYGKDLIKKIFEGNYLDGCTMGINADGSKNIYEVDIINAIKQMKGEPFVWD
jgi:hypothetical protein